MIRKCGLFSFAKWKTVANGKTDCLQIVHTLLISIVIGTGAKHIIKSETVFQSCLKTILYINIANLYGRNKCHSCFDRFSQMILSTFSLLSVYLPNAVIGEVDITAAKRNSSTDSCSHIELWKA